MVYQSLLITIMGMSSVFFFLFLLVCFMNLLRVVLDISSKKNLDKEALAIVLALKEKEGK
ncbi:MAG: OadG family protein [Alphaproteobacteria bacterium]|nr:OadG family protein [Alphaproteobacteria bacterium]